MRLGVLCRAGNDEYGGFGRGSTYRKGQRVVRGIQGLFIEIEGLLPRKE